MSTARMRLLPLAFAFCLAFLSPGAWSKVLLKPNGHDAMRMSTRSISADVRIDGRFASTTLTIVFQNECDRSTEADFIYELPSGAVATYFAYWAEDEKVVARIVEKKRAAEIYRRITEVRRDPALIEMTGKNTFRVRVSPVLANADLKVELRFVQVLPSDSGGAVYTLSLPQDQLDPLDDIDVRVRVEPDADILKVTNNIGIPVARAGGGYQVTLAGENYRPRKDINVRIVPRERPMLVSLYAARSGGDDGFFALALTSDHTIANPRLRIQGVRTRALAPAHLPGVRAHRTLAVFGRYAGCGRATVTLDGKSPAGPVCYSAQVDFGSGTEPENLASKLWAAHRIRDLSKSNAARRAVIELSKRFTLPSKFTSWLAVPKEEIARYKREQFQTRIDAVAVPLAELVVEGKEDAPAGKSLRAKLDAICAGVGLDPAEELRDRLVSRWDALGTPLAKLIADGKGDSDEARRIQARLSDLLGVSPDKLGRELYSSFSRILDDALFDVEEEKLDPSGDTRKLASLEARASRLAAAMGEDLAEYRSRTERHYKYDRPHRLASRLARLTVDGKGDQPEARDLRRRLEEACRDAGGTPADWMQSYFENYAREPASKLAQAIEHGEDTSPKGKALWQSVAAFCARVGINQTQCLGPYLYEPAQRLSEAYVHAISEGKSAAEARTLTGRLRRICEAGGLDMARELGNQWEIAASELARKLVDERHSPRPRRDRIATIRGRLAMIQRESGKPVQPHITELERQWAYSEMWGAQSELVDLLVAGKGDGARARLLRRRHAELCRRNGRNPKADIRSELQDRARWLSYDIGQEQYSPSPDPTRMASMNADMKRLLKLGGFSTASVGRWREEYWAFSGARDVQTLILAELEREKPNLYRLQRLTRRFNELASEWQAARPKQSGFEDIDEYGGLLDEAVDLKTESVKLAKEIKSVKSAGDQTRAAELEKRQTEVTAGFDSKLNEIRQSMRWGDPMISVQAPADALRVTALLPNGEIKTLEFNAATGRWEARFDIPAYAHEGDYAVTIVVVLKDGTRKTLALHYAVDLTPPLASAAARLVSGAASRLRLQIDADPDTARVAAILPWGERVEMDSSATPHRFTATIDVPEGHDAGACPIRFVLTDKAHNRTSMSVEVTPQ